MADPHYRKIQPPDLPEALGIVDQPSPMLQWVEIGSMVIDDRYQRPLNRGSIKTISTIAANFRWSCFTPVLLAPIEGGQFAVIDGQHRVHAALLISTIGPKIDWQWVMEISQEIHTIGLQFSLHQPADERRNNLIPFAKKQTLAEINQIGLQWADATGRRPFFNYCAGDDNTSVADADLLAKQFSANTWNATISVICERNEGMPARNDHQVKLAADFSSLLVQRGFDVRVFDPAGQDDIGGGCGQLWFVQDWMEKNRDKARPSIGCGKPKVHVPADLARMIKQADGE